MGKLFFLPFHNKIPLWRQAVFLDKNCFLCRFFSFLARALLPWCVWLRAPLRFFARGGLRCGLRLRRRVTVLR